MDCLALIAFTSFILSRLITTLYFSGAPAIRQAPTIPPPGGSTASTRAAFAAQEVRTAVQALLDRDPHQLYTRLRHVSTEHVMGMKVVLWRILVAPHDVPCLRRYYEMQLPAQALALAQAKWFVKCLLDDFTAFQDAVREVGSYLTALDTDYLRQFGVSWKLVNHHVFDAVIYQDELFHSFVPHMEAALQ